MTLLEVGYIARKYDTDMAHAFLHAVAVAIAGGRGADDLIGSVPMGWGL